jgi:imidazole glycerol phosphate synthase glutamine amidotransferase subunit
MIGILDFGSAGNARSVANALARAQAGTVMVREFGKEGGRLDGLVVPGVGSFSVVPKIISALGGREGVGKIRMPVLCICLGMQSLFDGSEEAPGVAGMGMVGGRVRRLSGPQRLPQLGWNRVLLARNDPLFEGIGSGEYFYFANSYAAFPAEQKSALAETEYNGRFASAVQTGNWWGVQFHPEKSGKAGQRMISNFARICGEKR